MTAAYRHMMRIIGEKRSIFTGLKAAVRKSSPLERSLAYLDRRVIFPVSFLNRFVFLWRMVTLCVSLRNKNPICTTPVAIVMIQNVQRHPAAAVRYPPIIGPAMMPSSGQRLIIDTAPPRCSGGNMSPIVPLLSVVDATIKPLKHRNAISIWMLVLVADPIEKMMKRMLAILYMSNFS